VPPHLGVTDLGYIAEVTAYPNPSFTGPVKQFSKVPMRKESFEEHGIDNICFTHGLTASRK